MEANRKILITGASGFIGYSLVDEAINKGYDVYATVRKSTDRSVIESKEINIVEVDFHDSHDLCLKLDDLPRFDFIIHNAGITRSLKKREYFEVNYNNTKRFVEALHQIDKMPRKFLYISSIASFGPGDSKSQSAIGLNTFPWPLTQYGRSKLAAERFITHTPGLPYIILRPTAVYGPRDSNFILAIKLIKKGFDFKIGLKSQKLTFIYVKDLAQLAIKVLESKIEKKSYFVSDGRVYDERDFGKSVAKALEKKVVHLPIPLVLAQGIALLNESVALLKSKAPVLSREKLLELSASNWNCDVKSLKTDYGFIPQYCLETGMRETIEWYKEAGWLK